MNIFRCLFYIIFLFTSNKAQSQWTQLEQPSGGMSWNIERVGSEIWNATNFGIFISSDEGITWNKHPTLHGSYMGVIAKGDSVMLMTEFYAGVANWELQTITSYDNGLNWNMPVVVESGSSYYSFGHREFTFCNGSILLNSNYVFFRSDDFGLTWNALNLPGGFSNVGHVNENYILTANAVNSTYSNYYSDNAGITWNFLDSSYASAISYAIGDTFYFACYTQDTNHTYFIARTSDFGITYDTLMPDSMPGITNLFRFNGVLYAFYYPSTGTCYLFHYGWRRYLESGFPAL